MNRCPKLIHPLAICCIVVASTASVKSEDLRSVSSQQIQVWIGQLGDDSFRVREQASQRLVESNATAQVVASLTTATNHSLLEVRTAARRLLAEISLRRFDANLARLNSLGGKTDTVELPAWKHFSLIAGDDLHSRRLFSHIARDHNDLLELIDQWSRAGKHKVTRRHAKISSAVLGFLDPYQLTSNNTNHWALLFCIDSPSVNHGMANLSTRVCSALGHSGLGPNLETARGSQAMTGDDLVLHRMISHWLRVHPNTGTSRDRLLIAMRYHCLDHANIICESTLDDALASPAEQVMALLCASVLGREDLEQRLAARVHDARTAHVWQLIASRKTKIRTQVRDVALALLLHHRSIDPRQVGFEELQADPLLVFRDHSLGFSDDASRSKAYEAANAALTKASN